MVKLAWVKKLSEKIRIVKPSTEKNLTYSDLKFKFKTNSRKISKISGKYKKKIWLAKICEIKSLIRPMHLQIQNKNFWRIFLNFPI